MLLMLATWPLWFGQSEFPRVPVFGMGAGHVAGWLLAGLCCAIVAQTARRRRTNAWLRGLTLLAGLLAVDHNLQRLQPWHWLFLLWLLLSLISSERRVLFRTTLATVYLFASLSRLGPDIAGGMTAQVLHAARSSIGLQGVLAEQSQFLLCAAMTGLEFSIGLGLLFARTRKFAWVCAVLMHATLLWLLGPAGLNHQPAVLTWNAMFLIAVPLLSWTPSVSSAFEATPKTDSSRRTLAVQIGLFAFPTLGLLSWFDNWPAWQLYSPRPDVVRVFITPQSLEGLPKASQAFVGDSVLILSLIHI